MNKVGDNQKVTGKAHVGDDVDFDLQSLVIGFAFLGEIGRIRVEQHRQPLFQAFARHAGEIAFGGFALGNRKLRQKTFAEAGFQVAAFGDFHRVGQRLGQVGEQLGHFFRAA